MVSHTHIEVLKLSKQVLDDNTYEERSRLKANIPVPLQSQGHRSAGPLQEVSEPDQDLTLPSQAVKTEGRQESPILSAEIKSIVQDKNFDSDQQIRKEGSIG